MILYGVLLLFAVFVFGCDSKWVDGNDIVAPETGYDELRPGAVEFDESLQIPDTVMDTTVDEIDPGLEKLRDNAYNFPYLTLGYSFFRGVVACEDIYLSGNVRLVGGMYASNNIFMGSGSVFTGENKLILDNLKKLSFKDNPIFTNEKSIADLSGKNLKDKDVRNLDNSNPIRGRQPLDITNLPRRYTVVQYRESAMNMDEWINAMKGP